MTYATAKAAYDVELNGTQLQLVENAFRRREDHPLIDTFVNASDVITADGYRRDVITINDQFPGPTIEVMQDSQVRHITSYTDSRGVGIVQVFMFSLTLLIVFQCTKKVKKCR